MLLYTQVFIAFLAIQALLRLVLAIQALLKLYSGSIKALSRPHPVYTQAFVFVIKALWRLCSIKAV